MIERFQWTFHAEQRLAQRGLKRHEIEIAVRLCEWRPNLGSADWRVTGVRPDGLRFVVVFDFPASDDPEAARVVTAWTIGESSLGLYPGPHEH
jgi:hypothetical protein